MCNVPVVFVSPELQGLISRLNINLIEPLAYEKMRNYLSVSDMGFSLVIDQEVRKHFHVQDLGPDSVLYQCLKQNSKDQNELINHIQPMLNSETFKATVKNYLQGSEETLNMMGDEPKFSLSVSHGVLVVGVQHGFYKTLEDKTSVKNFYRNCLELCQSTIPGSNLNDSDLFGKFVKLSISF